MLTDAALAYLHYACILILAGALSAEALLANTSAGFTPRPDYRPQTKFESRGLKLGHGVWDVVFRRRA